jgi:hypothetical protein
MSKPMSLEWFFEHLFKLGGTLDDAVTMCHRLPVCPFHVLNCPLNWDVECKHITVKDWQDALDELKAGIKRS